MKVSLKNLVSLGFVVAVACSSAPPSIVTEPISEISQLNQNHQIVAKLGPSPIVIESREPVLRLSLKPKDRLSIFFLVFSPKDLDGEIKMSLFPELAGKSTDEKNQGRSYSSALDYNDYIDKTLHAHRQILRGNLKEASIILDAVDSDYSRTYAVQSLRATIAVAEGNLGRASNFLKQANRLFSPDIKEELPVTAAKGESDG